MRVVHSRYYGRSGRANNTLPSEREFKVVAVAVVLSLQTSAVISTESNKKSDSGNIYDYWSLWYPCTLPHDVQRTTTGGCVTQVLVVRSTL